MSQLFEVITSPDREMLASLYAQRKHDRYFKDAYTGFTPDDIDQCVINALSGIYKPVFILNKGEIVSGHHLHDYDYRRSTAWSSGFIPKVARGRKYTTFRKFLWELTREVYLSWFEHIFAYVVAQNYASIRWTEMHRAGCISKCVTVRDRKEDVVLYTVHKGDKKLCRNEAQLLFPKHMIFIS